MSIQNSQLNDAKPSKGCAVPDCPNTVSSRFRKYCPAHSKQATALWKKAWREASVEAYKAARRTGSNAQMYYLKGWTSREAYNAHHCEAMRQSRARKKLPPANGGSPPASAARTAYL